MITPYDRLKDILMDNKSLIKKVLSEANDNIPVEQICEQNGISKATYYAWYSSYIFINGEIVSTVEYRANIQKKATNHLIKRMALFK